jgi:outer membrane protein OmpA-like peptidoglycan-associated protein
MKMSYHTTYCLRVLRCFFIASLLLAFAGSTQLKAQPNYHDEGNITVDLSVLDDNTALPTQAPAASGGSGSRLLIPGTKGPLSKLFVAPQKKAETFVPKDAGRTGRRIVLRNPKEISEKTTSRLYFEPPQRPQAAKPRKAPKKVASPAKPPSAVAAIKKSDKAKRAPLKAPPPPALEEPKQVLAKAPEPPAEPIVSSAKDDGAASDTSEAKTEPSPLKEPDEAKVAAAIPTPESDTKAAASSEEKKAPLAAAPEEPEEAKTAPVEPVKKVEQKVAAPAPSAPAPSAPSAPQPVEEAKAEATPKPAPEPEALSALPPSGGDSASQRNFEIVFPPEASKVPPDAKVLISTIIDKLNADENVRLQLMAYAGGENLPPSRARRLSLSRALALRAFFVDSGIRSTRIDVRALGNKTDKKPLNRVDINLITR